MITVTNYNPTPYRGVVRCGIADWPTHNSGTPSDPNVRDKCSRVVFGPVFGHHREAFLFVDLGPGQSVDVDVWKLDASPYEMPEIGDWSKLGRPRIEVREGDFEHLQPLDPIDWEPIGAGLRVHCATRVDDLLFVDVWIDYIPGQQWATFDVLVTAANPTYGEPEWNAPAKLTLGWQDAEHGALLFFDGMTAPTLFEAGDGIAQGQARAWSGVVAWLPLEHDDVAMQGAYGAAQAGVVAVCGDMPSPIGLPRPTLGRRHGSTLAWTDRHLARARKSLEGYQAPPLGVAANSGQTGAQEDSGYAKGAEWADCPAGLQVERYVAMGYARRPCHWVELGGQLLDPAKHPDLVFWSGSPHWHPNVSPDRLGLYRLPTMVETQGWAGPDREHWFANRLWSALQGSASPVLQRLAEHQAQAFLFGETVKPNWSTSNAGTSRGVGWTCLVVCNLLALLKNNDLRRRVRDRMVERIDKVLLPQLEPRSLVDGPRVAYRHSTTDGRWGGSRTYPEWWQVWQQAVCAFGLWMVANRREIQSQAPALADRVRGMAERFAVTVLEHASVRDPGLGWKTWENVALRADGQPLTPEEQVPGVGVTWSTSWRLWGQPLAFWVAAEAGHAEARQHYLRLRGEALDGDRDLAWLPPLTGV